MASRFPSGPLHLARFRQLISPSCSASQRLAFHTTPRNQILDICLGYTHSAFLGLHSFTGLSWASTIPLLALILRVTLTHPFILYSDKIREHRVLLQPIIIAWIRVIRQKVVQEHGEVGPRALDRIANRAIRLKRKEIYARHGIKLWKSALPAVQFPVFLLISETLRRMSGMGLGLLGVITGWLNSKPTAEELIEPPAVSLENPIDENLPDNFMDLFEPSFASGGALWFPDLLLPDPMCYLPFILSGSLALNVYYNLKSNSSQSKWHRRLYNTLMILALASGPLTLKFPCALLIYWISSSAFGFGHILILRWHRPLTPFFEPCKPRKERVLLGGHQAKQRGL